MVGMMEELPFDEREVILQPGDNVFVYTDGVPEAQNMSGQMFESEGMLKALNSAHDSGPEEIIGKVMDSIIAFRGDALQFDDITMLCIRYNGVK